MQLSILCNGDETQKSWKPLLNTILVLEAHRNVSHSGTYKEIYMTVHKKTTMPEQFRCQTGGFSDDPSYDYDSR